jgi:hypothetical protein
MLDPVRGVRRKETSSETPHFRVPSRAHPNLIQNSANHEQEIRC